MCANEMPDQKEEKLWWNRIKMEQQNLKPLGMPPHILALKIGSHIILRRNLDPSNLFIFASGGKTKNLVYSKAVS